MGSVFITHFTTGRIDCRPCTSCRLVCFSLSLSEGCTATSSFRYFTHFTTYFNTGRIYCNVQFSILETNDKVTLSWVACSHASIDAYTPLLMLTRLSCMTPRMQVTYTWIAPNGRRFHRKSLVKGLAQRRTWSWNFIGVCVCVPIGVCVPL